MTFKGTDNNCFVGIGQSEGLFRSAPGLICGGHLNEKTTQR